jgi:hypothetical protein
MDILMPRWILTGRLLWLASKKDRKDLQVLKEYGGLVLRQRQ